MTHKRPLAEQLRRLRDALDTMEPLPRAVFDMHRYSDLDFPQIADELGISVAEVERQFAAAMFHLLRSTHENGGP